MPDKDGGFMKPTVEPIKIDATTTASTSSSPPVQSSPYLTASSSMNEIHGMHSPSLRFRSTPRNRVATTMDECLKGINCLIKQSVDLESTNRRNEDLQLENQQLREEVFELSSRVNESFSQRPVVDAVIQTNDEKEDEKNLSGIETGVQTERQLELGNLNRFSIDGNIQHKGTMGRSLSTGSLFIQPISSSVRRIMDSNMKNDWIHAIASEMLPAPDQPQYEDDSNLEDLHVILARNRELEKHFLSTNAKLSQEMAKNSLLLHDVGVEQRRAEQAENEASRLRLSKKDLESQNSLLEKEITHRKKELQDLSHKEARLTSVTHECEKLRQENQAYATEIDYLRAKLPNTPPTQLMAETNTQIEQLHREYNEAMKRVEKAEKDVADHIVVVRRAAELEAQLQVTQNELAKREQELLKLNQEHGSVKKILNEQQVTHQLNLERCQNDNTRLDELLSEREHYVQVLCDRIALLEAEILGNVAEPIRMETENHGKDAEHAFEVRIQSILEVLQDFPGANSSEFLLKLRSGIERLFEGLVQNEDRDEISQLFDHLFQTILSAYNDGIERISENLADMEVRLKEKNAQLELLDEKFIDDRQKLVELKSRELDLEGRIKRMREEQKKVDQERGNLITENERLRKQNTHAQALQIQLEQKRTEFELAANGLKKAMQEIEECDEREERFKAELDELTLENQTLNKEIQIMQQCIEEKDRREMHMTLERGKMEKEIRDLRCDLSRLTNNQENHLIQRMQGLEHEIDQVKALHEKDKATNYKSSQVLTKGYFTIKEKCIALRSDYKRLLGALQAMIAKIEECDRLAKEQNNPFHKKLGNLSAKYGQVVQTAVDTYKKIDEEVNAEVLDCDKAVEDLNNLPNRYNVASGSKHRSRFFGKPTTINSN